MWHYYAEIYYNGRKGDGIYAYGSGVVSTTRAPDEAGWYDELRKEIANDLRASSTKPSGVIVISLTKL